MAINFNKAAFKLREALTQAKKKSGVFGETLLRTNTASEAHTILGTTGKNIFINGAMEVNQRDATSLNTGGFLLDRWKYSNSNYGGAITQSVQDDAPEGFAKSFKLLTTTGAVIGASGYHFFSQIIERNNTTHLSYSTYNAKPVTVSFWVKGNISGTYGLTLYNWQANRSINRSYTITRPGIWEKKTITFPGDVTGALQAGNGSGLELYFILGAGSSYKGSISTDWVGYSGTYFGGAQTADVGATTGGYWQITGIQMEVGTAATPFERRPIGHEVLLCQRYYTRFRTYSGGYVAYGAGVMQTGNSNTVATIYLKYPVQMRAAPTVTQLNTSTWDGYSQNTVTSLGGTFAGTDSLQQDINLSNTNTPGRGMTWCAYNTGNAYVALDAEL